MSDIHQGNAVPTADFDFAGRLGLVTGAGSGMGRELARQLGAEGTNLALSDLRPDLVEETAALVSAESPGVTVTTHPVDVSDEGSLVAWRDALLAAHDTDHAHLLFNNAGIGGAGSFLLDDRAAWERTFDVCWGGVYLGCRVLLPLLVAADRGHVINTASVNGFWASLGPDRPHTSYAAAKFAVKGFTEALLADLRLNAPHVGASVVMPGHIGTDIAANSVLAHGVTPDAEITERSNAFRNSAPTTAAEAAGIILDGVRVGRWRILVGEDAHVLDEFVRDTPEDAYEPAFIERLHAAGCFQALVN